MKPSIETLLVRYVVPVRVEKQRNMFTNRSKEVKVPTGDVHIFRTKKIVEQKKDKKPTVRFELYALSLCGKARGDIDAMTAEYENRPTSSVCPKCEAAWKAHPLSLWKSFTEGTGIASEAK